jgi:hypothetical protein
MFVIEDERHAEVQVGKFSDLHDAIFELANRPKSRGMSTPTLLLAQTGRTAGDPMYLKNMTTVHLLGPSYRLARFWKSLRTVFVGS